MSLEKKLAFMVTPRKGRENGRWQRLGQQKVGHGREMVMIKTRESWAWVEDGKEKDKRKGKGW